MGHHCHHHHSSTDNIKAAFFLNLAFTIIEIIGALLTNSVAILSDAIHDLGDSLSLGLAWWLEHYSEKAPSEVFTYGYKRFSLLGGLINAAILLAGSTLVLFESVPRLFAPEPTNAPGMIALAILGVLVNGAAVLKLSGGKNENSKVLTWHLLEDVLGWSAVLVGSILIYFTDYYLIDALLSIGITSFIIWNVFKRLNSTVSLFLQGIPREIDLSSLIKQLLEVDGVHNQHHTHVWSLDGEHHVLSTHLEVAPETAIEETLAIKKEVRRIAQHSGFSHVTVEIEFSADDCSSAA